jgi:hypothetical protein
MVKTARIGRLSTIDKRQKPPPQAPGLGKNTEIWRFTWQVKRQNPPPQASAARWWAALAPEQRDMLKAEFPKALTPEWLQKSCRERHPDWAKTRKSGASGPPGSVRTRRPKPKKPTMQKAPKSDFSGDLFPSAAVEGLCAQRPSVQASLPARVCDLAGCASRAWGARRRSYVRASFRTESCSTTSRSWRRDRPPLAQDAQRPGCQASDHASWGPWRAAQPVIIQVGGALRSASPARLLPVPCRSPRDRPSAKVSRPGPRRPVPPRSGD